eukprot:CAMPEP_0201483036 /NCGR_PEP_ID=MMETSP0151_2-20130828/7275_1 /ASSEMBLY_ACC=CAM_ASM_000257 /TAXON_ID=200890 /ORGANISM="Paramoeba atlantica, Strain 621/1 / CCAP 1560/9" /LENGTH=143 /DNA_ID=CAMNT_0047865993 /DNA_START=56 /DNA_END=487 /DNA_ORIENTATION=-
MPRVLSPAVMGCSKPTSHLSEPAPTSAHCSESVFSHSAHSYCTASETAQPTESAATGATPGECPALEVAMAVNRLKRSHQATNTGQEKKQMELQAWQMLNSLSEDSIMNAQGKAIALLLNSWAYFSKHWEKGKDGPTEVAESQ